MKQYYLVLLVFSLLVNEYQFAQTFADEDSRTYQELLEAGEYDKATEKIEEQIAEINSKNTSNKRIPSNFISFASIEQEIDVNSLFNERTVENFLIEENPELHKLHYDAAIINYRNKEYKRASSHLHQSLRYKKIEFRKDDYLFALLSRIYRDSENEIAYRNSLEIAFRLNPAIAEYSHDLGISYYNSRDKRKSIYYLVYYAKLLSYEVDDPSIFIKIANQNADINKNLEAEKYYLLFLEKENDYNIYYVVGNLAFKETGNYDLAQNSYLQVTQKAPESESLKRSKSMEHLGDIAYKRMKYSVALEWFLKSIELEKDYENNLKNKREEINELKTKMNELKIELLKNNNYVQYNEYQYLKQEQARLKREEIQLSYELRKHTSGNRRWKTAVVYEKVGDLENSLLYYREAIKYNYQPNKAREMIEKIQLKINRGY